MRLNSCTYSQLRTAEVEGTSGNTGSRSQSLVRVMVRIWGHGAVVDPVIFQEWRGEGVRHCATNHHFFSNKHLTPANPHLFSKSCKFFTNRSTVQNIFSVVL